MIRIYKYPLRLTKIQEDALKNAEKTCKKVWNMLVREMKSALRDIENGRTSTIKNNLFNILSTKKLVGVRAVQLNKKLELGESKENALKELINVRLDKLTKRLTRPDGSRCLRRFARKLAGNYASELVNSRREWLGNKESKGIVTSIITKWNDIIDAWEKGTKGQPRFKKYNDSASIQKQITSKNFKIENEYVDLSFAGSLVLEKVKMNQYREFPTNIVIKQIGLKQENNIWYVSFFIEGEDSVFKKDFTDTNGHIIGIDPGVKCALTTSDGEKYTPDKKITSDRIVRKLARLQRKKDRQIRINNPHCFNEKGMWVKGKKIRTYTKGMVNSANDILSISKWQQNSRKDFYHKTAIDILNSGDIVKIGNWIGVNSGDKGIRKKSHEHAISTFVTCIKDKANLSKTSKMVFDVNEKYSTVTCSTCGNKTGPTGKEDLSVRQWVCSNCKSVHDRDINAAKNIASSSVSQTEQTTTLIKKSRKVRSLTKSMTRATEINNPQGVELKSEAVANGQVITQPIVGTRASDLVVTEQDVKNLISVETSFTTENVEHSQRLPDITATQDVMQKGSQ